ncbi:MAG: ATP-binding protein [Promethearchaeota archaeon]
MRIQNKSCMTLSISLVVLFWVLESLTHTYIFNQGSFIKNFLFIDLHELWMRFIAIFIIIFFSIIIERFLNEHKTSENQIKHLNQVLESIQNISKLITNEKDLNRLIQGITDNLIKNRGYNNAWIVRIENSTLILSAHSKLGNKAKLLESNLKETATLNCIRLALDTSGLHLIKDPASFCTNCPLSQDYTDLSAFTIQLERNGKNLGILTVSIPRNYADSLEEQKLFKEIADDVSYALFTLELEKKRKYIEDALKKEELKFQRLVENMKEGLLLEDTDGYIRYVNPRACELLNFQEEELVGKHWTEIAPEKDRERLITESKKRIMSISSSYESVLHTRDNQRIPAIVSSNPYFSEEGEFQGVLSVFTDIREQKILEMRRKKFIEITSHELRTPLTCIKGFIEVLERQNYDIDLQQKKYCYRLINKNVARLERLIEDVSDISLVERGPFHLNMQEVNFNDYIKNEAEMYSTLLGEHFSFEPDSCNFLIILHIDKERISQVLNNIIDNAKKQTSPKNRLITLRTEIREDEGKVRIIVCDNGIGIAPENLKKIFEEFVTFETTYSLGGAGVGLFLSKVIIMNHNGKIYAESDGTNTGASIIFELPIYKKNEFS